MIYISCCTLFYYIRYNLYLSTVKDFYYFRHNFFLITVDYKRETFIKSLVKYGCLEIIKGTNSISTKFGLVKAPISGNKQCV